MMKGPTLLTRRNSSQPLLSFFSFSSAHFNVSPARLACFVFFLAYT